MGMKIVLECDGLNCTNSEEIDEATDENIQQFDWLSDPNESEYHYCPSCAPIAKSEWESEPYVDM